jgi:hypothetical protein
VRVLLLRSPLRRREQSWRLTTAPASHNAASSSFLFQCYFYSRRSSRGQRSIPFETRGRLRGRSRLGRVDPSGARRKLLPANGLHWRKITAAVEVPLILTPRECGRILILSYYCVWILGPARSSCRPRDLSRSADSVAGRSAPPRGTVGRPLADRPAFPCPTIASTPRPPAPQDHWPAKGIIPRARTVRRVRSPRAC